MTKPTNLHKWMEEIDPTKMIPRQLKSGLSQYKVGMILSATNNRRHLALKNYLENRYAMDHLDEYLTNTTRLLSQLNKIRAESILTRNRCRREEM